ncbi:FAD-dependent oxidoreductase [Bartonella sp. HY038]|uniref:FAD-dependent oxidoreductase n=1 Tax=Bartonella sp. HY038 TaxID=2759660 RepID=UPI0015FC11C6|nr:FAD-dependent oxidoreductase [Bartonella sp. HY038]
MQHHPSSDMEQIECDLLVIGSGAGGLSAAVTAAYHGLDVLVVEKDAYFGGTTAFSGGWLWIPQTSHAKKAGIIEGDDAPRLYLKNIMGNRYDDVMVDTYLKKAPEMVDFFETKTDVAFNGGNAVPDFHGKIDGAVIGGRSVVAAPFDGRKLGDLLYKLRKPIPQMTLMGMAIASGADMRAFLTTLRSISSFSHVTKRLMRHFYDLAFYRRSTQIVNGNALVARLLKSAQHYNVRLLSDTPALSLIKNNDDICGAIIEKNGVKKQVFAKYGTVLATGGFPHDQLRKKRLFDHVQNGSPHESAAPLSVDGDGLKMAENIGALVDETLISSGAWAPVSLVSNRQGGFNRFPHLVERGKPGLIAVRQDGKRFVAEDISYHDFMVGLLNATPKGEPVTAWLLADHRFIRRYGLGAVKPFPVPFTKWLKNGYLKRANSVAELAQKCGIDEGALQKTIANYNRDAAQGIDNEFHRGTTPYQLAQGDKDHLPNPCIAPIVKAPFFAVEITAGSLGTFAGLICDDKARVLDGHGEPINGLFAAGNDMNSIFAGTYPSGGITLGPAMTFGYIIGESVAAARNKVQENKI